HAPDRPRDQGTGPQGIEGDGRGQGELPERREGTEGEAPAGLAEARRDGQGDFRRLGRREKRLGRRVQGPAGQLRQGREKAEITYIIPPLPGLTVAHDGRPLPIGTYVKQTSRNTRSFSSSIPTRASRSRKWSSDTRASLRSAAEPC